MHSITFNHRQMVLTDLKLGENAHWYNPGQVLYYAFTKGNYSCTDPETGLRYYIDPISMIVSKLQESTKINILPFIIKFIIKLFQKFMIFVVNFGLNFQE
jgi:hypothetical protein